MVTILAGAFIISILHGFIPNHWLPVIAVGKRENWTLAEVRRVSLIASLAHSLSTILIGLILSVVGAELSENIDYFAHFIAPVLLVSMGLVFLCRQHRHKQPDVPDDRNYSRSKRGIILAVVTAMFFSPCMEIEAYFLLAGSYGLLGSLQQCIF